MAQSVFPMYWESLWELFRCNVLKWHPSFNNLLHKDHKSMQEWSQKIAEVYWIIFGSYNYTNTY
jgi:hypothetical protein